MAFQRLRRQTALPEPEISQQRGSPGLETRSKRHHSSHTHQRSFCWCRRELRFPGRCKGRSLRCTRHRAYRILKGEYPISCEEISATCCVFNSDVSVFTYWSSDIVLYLYNAMPQAIFSKIFSYPERWFTYLLIVTLTLAHVRLFQSSNVCVFGGGRVETSPAVSPLIELDLRKKSVLPLTRRIR